MLTEFVVNQVHVSGVNSIRSWDLLVVLSVFALRAPEPPVNCSRLNHTATTGSYPGLLCVAALLSCRYSFVPIPREPRWDFSC